MRPMGIFAKIMAPIGRLMMGKAMRKCIDQDLDDLKKAAESGPEAGPEPAPA